MASSLSEADKGRRTIGPLLAPSAYGYDMDVEHNACMLGRAGWPARLRGALIHTHTEHNHTCGELETLSRRLCFGS